MFMPMDVVENMEQTCTPTRHSADGAEMHVHASVVITMLVGMTSNTQLVGRASMALSAINKYYAYDIMCKAFKLNKNKRKNF